MEIPMPLGTLHTIEGVIRRKDRLRFVIVVHAGGEWELEPDGRVMRHIDRSVTIEGVRTGFNRLEVVRIKPDGEDWPPEQSWTRWFDRWRKRTDRGE